MITKEEFEDFEAKLDWEGGIDGLLGYGGYTAFPQEVAVEAKAFDDAKEALRAALSNLAIAIGYQGDYFP